MKALRILMYSSLCSWPLAHLQSENTEQLIKPVSLVSGEDATQ